MQDIRYYQPPCHRSQYRYNRSEFENGSAHMPKQPIEFMFSPYRRELLARLLLRPDEQFHVRELERMTGISAGSLHRELKAMAESGLLRREQIGNQVFYKADINCAIFNELAAIFRKTIGIADLLKDALANLAGKIKVAFVFGSVASCKATAGSDLDVCVIGDVSLREVVAALAPLKQTLRRDINPVVMTASEFRKQLAAKDRFIRSLLGEPKLFAIGNDDELGKPRKNRVAGKA
jgi:predicted nucleotidyltransferase